jgi:hypothetical protein
LTPLPHAGFTLAPLGKYAVCAKEAVAAKAANATRVIAEENF